MLPPQAQDYALSFIAKRLAIQVPSRALPAPNSDGFAASSLAQFIPFIQQLTDYTFPLQHVSMRTLVEVVILQLRALASAIETIDESDLRLDMDMDMEAKHAAEGLEMIHVRKHSFWKLIAGGGGGGGA